MLDKRHFVVIGMGRFGIQVASTLAQKGLSVLAIDKDSDVIDDIKDELEHVTIANATEEGSLRALGINDFDVAIVAIGESLENNILTTAILKNLKVKQIIVRATTKLHKTILETIGATRVVLPEEEMGVRIANSLAAASLVDNIEFSEGFSIAQIKVSSELAGKSLIEANLRAEYNVNVVAIKQEFEVEENDKKEKKEKIVVPSSNYILLENDILIVVGKNEDINTFGSL
ncbi:MAG: potassium channel family protein [Candidatus Muiribacteriota bacterium]